MVVMYLEERLNNENKYTSIGCKYNDKIRFTIVISTYLSPVHVNTGGFAFPDGFCELC